MKDTYIIGVGMNRFGKHVDESVKSMAQDVIQECIVDAALEKSIPMGRIGEARDIANIILALVADESDYITGQIIHVDGGATTGIRM